MGLLVLSLFWTSLSETDLTAGCASFGPHVMIVMHGRMYVQPHVCLWLKPPPASHGCTLFRAVHAGRISRYVRASDSPGDLRRFVDSLGKGHHMLRIKGTLQPEIRSVRDSPRVVSG